MDTLEILSATRTELKLLSENQLSTQELLLYVNQGYKELVNDIKPLVRDNYYFSKNGTLEASTKISIMSDAKTNSVFNFYANDILCKRINPNMAQIVTKGDNLNFLASDVSPFVFEQNKKLTVLPVTLEGTYTYDYEKEVETLALIYIASQTSTNSISIDSKEFNFKFTGLINTIFRQYGADTSNNLQKSLIEYLAENAYADDAQTINVDLDKNSEALSPCYWANIPIIDESFHHLIVKSAKMKAAESIPSLGEMVKLYYEDYILSIKKEYQKHGINYGE